MSYLAIHLTAESRETVRSLAIYPEIRGDHVTLAYPENDRSFSSDWIPGNYSIREKVSTQAVGIAHDDRIQVLLVEVAGLNVRPWDGGKLHITVSKQPGVPSVEANRLLESTPVQPFECALEGVVQWNEQ